MSRMQVVLGETSGWVSLTKRRRKRLKRGELIILRECDTVLVLGFNLVIQSRD